MLWQVLRVFLCVIITFDYLKAADLPRNACENENYNVQEMLIRNTVEPVVNAALVNVHELKVSVRLKLREIFENQFPDRILILRAYETENWPSGVDTNDPKKWKKHDLLRINERIPYYQFVQRETVLEDPNSSKEKRKFLNEIECLTNATLKEDYYKKFVGLMILNRFKVESGQPSAKYINWRLLDRSQVPAKYKNVPLNAGTFSSKLIYKNPEIMDNIHFYWRFPEFNAESMRKFNAYNHEFHGLKQKDTNCANCDKLEFDDHSLDISEAFDFDIHCGDLEKLGKSANEDDENCFDCESECSIESMTILESSRNSSKVLKDVSFPRIDKMTIYDLRKKMNADLQNLFEVQYPGKIYKRREYEIQNWPEGVCITPDRWRRKEIEKIRENMHEFVFVKRPETFSISSESGLDKLDDLKDILDHSMTQKGLSYILLKRYREETGQSSALKINWNLLDRRNFPERYKDVKINSVSMKLNALFKNPEIINNIHFFKVCEDERPKRKRKIEGNSNSY